MQMSARRRYCRSITLLSKGAGAQPLYNPCMLIAPQSDPDMKLNPNQERARHAVGVAERAEVLLPQRVEALARGGRLAGLGALPHLREAVPVQDERPLESLQTSIGTVFGTLTAAVTDAQCSGQKGFRLYVEIRIMVVIIIIIMVADAAVSETAQARRRSSAAQRADASAACNKGTRSTGSSASCAS